MMLKSPEFWREIGRIRKWSFLIRVMPYTLVPSPGLSSHSLGLIALLRLDGDWYETKKV